MAASATFFSLLHGSYVPHMADKACLSKIVRSAGRYPAESRLTEEQMGLFDVREEGRHHRGVCNHFKQLTAVYAVPIH